MARITWLAPGAGGQILLQTTAGNLSMTADQRQSLEVGLQRIADLDEQIQAVQAYVEETASQLSTTRSSASNRLPSASHKLVHAALLLLL